MVLEQALVQQGLIRETYLITPCGSQRVHTSHTVTLILPMMYLLHCTFYCAHSPKYTPIYLFVFFFTLRSKWNIVEYSYCEIDYINFYSMIFRP